MCVCVSLMGNKCVAAFHLKPQSDPRLELFPFLDRCTLTLANCFIL